MSEFTKGVIDRIKREGIEPEAGWKFSVKRSLLWVGIVLAAGLGALSLSMAMFSLLSIDRNPLTLAPDRLFSFAFFRSLPFFWIGLALAFPILAVFEFRNTRHGYRHRIVSVAIISGIAIIASASLLSAWGADELAERVMADRFPNYAKMTEMRETFWFRPKDGFLSGTITGATPNAILLVDRDGKQWKVVIGKTTTIRPAVRLEKGFVIKTVGEQKNDSIFEAEDIRPWDRPGKPPFDERRRMPDRGPRDMMQPF